MTVNLRLANIGDSGLIAVIAKIFISESAYGYTYSEAETRRITHAYLTDPYHGVVLAEIDGQAAGIWIGAVIHEWANEPICYLTKFYILPWARGRGVADALMANFVKWADDNDCLDIFATSTANIGAGEAFQKLCEKHGFVPIGQTMMRRKP